MVLNNDPRREIWDLIMSKELETLLKPAGILHGHYCPGLALGVRAGAEMVRRLRAEHEGMEDVLAIVETNNCFSDGIQFTTGCTFGNNSLIFRDFGKTAVTLTRRDGNAIRACVKPNASDTWRNEFPEYSELFQKVIAERKDDQEHRAALKRLSKQASFHMMRVGFEELFDIQSMKIEVPDYAQVYSSSICTQCHESIMATREVDRNGRKYCISCARSGYYELNGNGIEFRGEET